MIKNAFDNFLYYFSLANSILFIIVFSFLDFSIDNKNVQRKLIKYYKPKEVKPAKLIKIKNNFFYEKSLIDKINLFKFDKNLSIIKDYNKKG